jgi:type II secretory pathway pseudopilin PulG
MHKAFIRQQGTVLLLAALLLIVAMGCVLALQLALPASEAARRRATERALGEAREALLAYAADRPIDPIVGPGYLPCPDTDDDGWAEPTCGSLSGDSGQEQRLGRLPWKTLGLADLREAAGERLWYAVSTKYKGLLNCAASAGCVDMSPDAALGTITVREAPARCCTTARSMIPRARTKAARPR